MRNWVAVFAFSITAFGCGQRNGQLSAVSTTAEIAKAPSQARGLEMEILPEFEGEIVRLQCNLRNLTLTAIEVDQSTLPWNNADEFTVDAIAADGTKRLLEHRPPPVVLERLDAASAPIRIEPGRSYHGAFNLEMLPIKNLSPNKDWTVHWSYGNLRVWQSDAEFELNGSISIKAESRAAAIAAALDPILHSSFGGTSVSPYASDDTWFNPPGGTWIPERAFVLEIRLALDPSLRALLETKEDAQHPPARYWFQYLGEGAGTHKTIYFFGHPFPIGHGASEKFFGAYIPESCHVEGSYNPMTKKVENLVVGGFNCPLLDSR